MLMKGFSPKHCLRAHRAWLSGVLRVSWSCLQTGSGVTWEQGAGLVWQLHQQWIKSHFAALTEIWDLTVLYLHLCKRIEWFPYCIPPANQKADFIIWSPEYSPKAIFPTAATIPLIWWLLSSSSSSLDATWDLKFQSKKTNNNTPPPKKKSVSAF